MMIEYYEIDDAGEKLLYREDFDGIRPHKNERVVVDDQLYIVMRITNIVGHGIIKIAMEKI